MARYELGQEFWDITIDDKRLVIVSGAIGKVGKQSVRKFVSADHAQTQFVKLTGEKQTAGWTYVEQASKRDDSDDDAALGEVHDPKLEAAILANPYDEAAYSVYGDWLQAQGSPRGELIALQLAEENAPDDPKLRAATRKYVAAQHRSLWAGLEDHVELHDGNGPALVWRFGFIHRIELDREMDEDCVTDRLLQDVLRHPSGRFVTAISIRDTATLFLVPAMKVIGTYAPATLREVAIRTAGRIDGIEPLMRSPLTKLTLKARDETGMTTACILSLTRVPATLTSLELRFADEDSVVKLAPLFKRRDLTALRELTLRGFTMPDELCTWIAMSPFAHQLEHVDIGLVGIDATSLAMLTDRTKLSALRTIGLTRELVTPKALAAFTTAGIKVENIDRDPDDLDRDPDDDDDEYYDAIQE